MHRFHRWGAQAACICSCSCFSIIFYYFLLNSLICVVLCHICQSFAWHFHPDRCPPCSLQWSPETRGWQPGGWSFQEQFCICSASFCKNLCAKMYACAILCPLSHRIHWNCAMVMSCHVKSCPFWHLHLYCICLYIHIHIHTCIYIYIQNVLYRIWLVTAHVDVWYVYVTINEGQCICFFSCINMYN